MALRLDPFDPDREFVTQRIFRANGVPWGRGFPFDKSTVNEPILRRLYENRDITYADSPRGQELLGRFQKQIPTIPAGVKVHRRSDEKPAETMEHASEDGEAAASDLAEEDRVKRLTQQHSRAALFQRASDLPGAKQSMTKAQLATLLVKSGRDGD